MRVSPNILDHPLIGERYFFPRAEPMDDATIVDTGSWRLGCYHESPHGPDALTLLHFHGNGEVIRDYRPEAVNALLSLGVNVFMAEYRGYGPSSGDPALVAMFDDLPAIVAATGVPPSQLVVFGRSIGSIYAIECARRWSDIAGLVLESGIHDVLERILLRVDPDELGCELAELQAASRRDLDHAGKLAGYAGPLLVLHAEHDGIVDVSHARRNLEAAGGAQKKLVVFPRGTHNDLLAVNYPDYMSELESFIRSLRAG